MLILTRKPDQSIIIDDEIVITVLAVEGDRVKLGITAPRHIAVLREEVRRGTRGENERAVTPERSRARTRAGSASISGDERSAARGMPAANDQLDAVP